MPGTKKSSAGHTKKEGVLLVIRITGIALSLVSDPILLHLRFGYMLNKWRCLSPLHYIS